MMKRFKVERESSWKLKVKCFIAELKKGKENGRIWDSKAKIHRFIN